MMLVSVKALLAGVAFAVTFECPSHIETSQSIEPRIRDWQSVQLRSTSAFSSVFAYSKEPEKIPSDVPRD